MPSLRAWIPCSVPSLTEESLGNRRIPVDVAGQAQEKKGMIVLLAEIEIRMLTKQTPTGGSVLPQTALMTTLLEEVMISLETSIEIVTIQTGIGFGMGIQMGIMTAHAGIWIAMGIGIAMMTEAAETRTKVMIPGQAAAEEHLEVVS
jgi:hypothetical protein